MKVSVCIAAYNSGKYLPACLASVFNQEGVDFEVIIVDDCSAESPEPIVDGYRTDVRGKIIFKRLDCNHGSAGAYTQAMKLATGDYICCLPADDMLTHGSLAARAEFLDQHPEVGHVFGYPTFIDEDGNQLDNHPYHSARYMAPMNLSHADWLKELAKGTFTFACTLMLRRSIFEKVGGSRRYYQQLADLEWYIRMAKEADVRVIPKAMGSFRIRSDGANESAPTKENAERAARELTRIKMRHFTDGTLPTKLMIASPFYMSQGFSDFMSSNLAVARMLTERGIDWDVVALKGDSYIDRARNTIVATFLESDYTDLLMVDTDLKFDPNGVLRLIGHPEEIVGGAYPQKNNWGSWSSVPLPPVSHPIHGQMFQGREIDDGTALLKALTVSAGFSRTKRGAFEKFAEHYEDMVYRDPSADPVARKRVYTTFFACEVRGYVRLGEDSRFCRMWREMGGELWIDPAITFTHWGVKGWEGNYHESLLKPPEEIDRLRKLKAGDQAVTIDTMAKAAA